MIENIKASLMNLFRAANSISIKRSGGKSNVWISPYGGDEKQTTTKEKEAHRSRSTRAAANQTEQKKEEGEKAEFNHHLPPFHVAIPKHKTNPKKYKQPSLAKCSVEVVLHNCNAKQTARAKAPRDAFWLTRI